MRTIKVLFLSLFLISSSVLFAQDPPPPPPPGAHGSEINSSPSPSGGGGAPIGSGIYLLSVLAISYGIFRRKKTSEV